jgi:hypothetical protein
MEVLREHDYHFDPNDRIIVKAMMIISREDCGLMWDWTMIRT